MGGANQRPFVLGLAAVTGAQLLAGWLTAESVCGGPLTPLRLPLLALTCQPDTAAWVPSQAGGVTENAQGRRRGR